MNENVSPENVRSNNLNVTPVIQPAVAPNVKKRKLSQTQEVQNQMNEALKILKTAVVSENTDAKKKREKDHLELFTDLLLAKIRALGEQTQDIAMHEIDILMFRLKNDSKSQRNEVPVSSLYCQQSQVF